MRISVPAIRAIFNDQLMIFPCDFCSLELGNQAMRVYAGQGPLPTGWFAWIERRGGFSSRGGAPDKGARKEARIKLRTSPASPKASTANNNITATDPVKISR